MEDWQTPIMKAMAKEVTHGHGDILEIGFGRGVSAEMIQAKGVRSHTIIESNDHSVNHYFRPWRDRHQDQDIQVVHSRWQDALDQLGTYDGIFFHAFPLDDAEFIETVVQSITFAEHFFATAASLLRQGGVFTYLTTEIDSMSRRHQRALFKHFSRISMSVQEVNVPQNTHDTWWADSMIIVRAEK
jgi:guanidinoacetate N-methyltransferase